MAHKFRQVLVALSLVGSAIVSYGCTDLEPDGAPTDAPAATRIDVPRNAFTPISPELSTWSDAANPLGWADRAERRAAEEAFARGEDAPIQPPSAIGGGPQL